MERKWFEYKELEMEFHSLSGKVMQQLSSFVTCAVRHGVMEMSGEGVTH